MKVVIPSRLGSTRLPNKPLVDIAGEPLIVHVWRRGVEAVGGEDVIVAADDASIVEAVKAAGGQAVMTDEGHQSGTDRVREVAEIMGWDDQMIIVNLQGDEPLMPADLIRQTGEILKRSPGADMATLAVRLRRLDDILSPHMVKVVCSGSGRALYFSRAAIPACREPRALDVSATRYLRHVGIYGFRVGALKKFSACPVSPLEEVEKLEQLRALDADMHIQVEITESAPHHGVDTYDDLARVRSRMEVK